MTLIEQKQVQAVSKLSAQIHCPLLKYKNHIQNVCCKLTRYIMLQILQQLDKVCRNYSTMKKGKSFWNTVYLYLQGQKWFMTPYKIGT